MFGDVLELLALHLTDRAEKVAIVGDNAYIVLADEPRVLKITCSELRVSDVRITLTVINPDNGPIDAAGFDHTPSQEDPTLAVQRLDQFMAIWFD